MDPQATGPTNESPLQGSCLCRAVRFEITAPLLSAGYCHCTHCRRRTGTAAAPSAMVACSGLRVHSGEELLESFQPTPQSRPKVFCRRCGGHLFSGDQGSAEGFLGVRFGAFAADPGIRPQYRQWVASAPAWEPIPDDGLPRYPGARNA